MKKKILFFMLLYMQSTGALVQELGTLTDALQDLAKHLTIPPHPSAGLLSLAQDRLIGPTTTPAMLGAQPPYILKSGNQILQVEVLSQFLTLGALTGKDYNLQDGLIMFLLPPSQQTNKAATSFMQSYVKRITGLSANNKDLQDRDFKWVAKDVIIGGGPASCGYQALKNAQTMLRALQTEDHKKGLEPLIDIRYANHLFGQASIEEVLQGKKQDGIWRELIIKNFREKAILEPFLRAKFRLEQYFVTQSEAPDVDIYGQIKAGINNVYQDMLMQLMTKHVIEMTKENIIQSLTKSNPELTSEIVEQYMLPLDANIKEEQSPTEILSNAKNQQELTGEWISANELEFLVEYVTKPENLPISVYETSIKVLQGELAKNPELNYQQIIEDRIARVASLFNNTVTNYSHAFIIGGASQAAPFGHWITLVISINNNVVQYFILDSMNAPRYQTALNYTNQPAYAPGKIIGPNDSIANHVTEIIDLIEKARAA